MLAVSLWRTGTRSSSKCGKKVTNTNMPPIKQPPTMRQKLIKEISDLLKERSKTRIEKLYKAAITGLEDYLEEIYNMQRESEMYSELLTSLPVQIFRDISCEVFRKVIDTISKCDDNFRESGCSTYDKQYETVCRDMVRSVLCPSIRHYFTPCTWSSIPQRLVIENFDYLLNLTVLVFNMKSNIDNSAILASNIHHLKKLMIFEYICHCSDQVVKQLGLHCHNLSRIRIAYSEGVTDLSVPYLQKLTKLSYVNISETSISTQLYQVLLTDLSGIRNIDVAENHIHILDDLVTENLKKITHYSGLIKTVTILTEKCPNVTSVRLIRVNLDLSNLTVLTRLVKLKIEHSDYEMCNLQAVFNGVGYRLDKLILINVENVNICDIIMKCSNVKNLITESCIYVPVPENKVFHPATPHFGSVTNLRIYHNPSDVTMYNKHLRYYANLTNFYCAGIKILSDDIFIEAVQLGGLRNLEILHVSELNDRQLTRRTIDILLHSCANLKILGYLETWNVSEDDISFLEDRIINENLDLKILI
ncbi:uncharacterized protein LOC110828546 isoform X2 [Zootermopsis nevadensis]|uniref:uncharacterized protein LOC110828546 isoform X2 n=1 Tax=Zootermopsis nevadensis TaxID=136037 RepID=UPI000B8EB1F9|nr:uncharacterized protein LOC110828546 isoform X2 [Zootermopsis nevadensis]